MSATISVCGCYRYDLKRTLTPERTNSLPRTTAIWIMLNPSTADAQVDDPTIRRCMNLSRSWQYDELVVVNLFAYRATDPRELKRVEDPVGPHNDEHLRRRFAMARPHRDLVVAGWGVGGRLYGRDQHVLEIVKQNGHWPHCVGHTKSGYPRHPLYVPGASLPQLYGT